MVIMDGEAQIDVELVEAVAGGNTDALGQLYDRHAPRLLGVAIAILGNRRDAEDLLHDVFMELWQKAGTYDPGRGKVAYWLVLRVRSRAIDRQRSLGVKREYLMQAGMDVDREAAATSTNVEAIEAVECLMVLPDRQREIVVMSYFQGYTCQEISDLMHVPLGTIKSRLAGAIKKMRIHMRVAHGAA